MRLLSTLQFPSGGGFSQADQALSFYAAGRTGPLWGNAVASFDLTQSNVARQVPLGAFTDRNSGNTNGQALALALALRGGYDIHMGQVTTGPVAGMVLQHVRINGFTETGTTGVTALGFGGQTRDSAVSQIGWREAVDVGNWQPFAELTWNHEWDAKTRTMTAWLTSTAAPDYTTPAFPVASDWATASAGSSYRLNRQVTLRGTLWGEFVNPQLSSVGGDLGINVSF